MRLFHSVSEGYEDDNYEEVSEYKRKGDGNMLEQNTDRSYFMIGAVVVAGIIIGVAVWLFDVKVFGEGGVFTNAFDSITSTATKAIEQIGDPVKRPDKNIITGLGVQLKAALSMMFL